MRISQMRSISVYALWLNDKTFSSKKAFSHGWILKYAIVIVWTIDSDVYKSKCIMCIIDFYSNGTKSNLYNNNKDTHYSGLTL